MIMLRQRSMRATALGLAAGLFTRGVRAQTTDGNNIIQYPDTKGLTYNYLDTVDVVVTTDYTTPYLYLYCWDANGIQQGE